uniref:Uncharacterized protein n=1 Tax=Spongospora subterranea TaxID=70186 RepID=A0A0H5QPM4_9EUKA|eukprot:CRZ03316.1 hypothetical protein [Spongospora subterranea]
MMASIPYNTLIMIAAGSLAGLLALAIRITIHDRHRLNRIIELSSDIESNINSMLNSIDLLSTEITKLSSRILEIECHIRSNTTALRAYNTTTTLSIRKHAEAIDRLRRQANTSEDDISLYNPYRSTPIYSLIDDQNDLRKGFAVRQTSTKSPSRFLESRFTAKCDDNQSVDEAASEVLSEFMTTAITPDFIRPADLRLRALSSIRRKTAQHL